MIFCKSTPVKYDHDIDHLPGGDDTISLLSFFSGIIVETFDALVTSNGTVVTMTLEKAGGGDLIMNFSDGQTALDCTPALTIALTAGTDASPQSNYIYILKSDKILTKSTTAWPSAEHIKVSYFLVPSASLVNTGAAGNNFLYINQNHNDHASDTSTKQGHLLHITQRSRRQGAIWSSGCEGIATQDGTDLWVSIATGVISQMHEHTFAALNSDTAGAGDKILVINDPDTAYTPINSLNEITKHSDGSAIGNNKYVKFVLIAVANKSGEVSPMMLTLPSGEYNNAADADTDLERYASFAIPQQYTLDSSTGFLVAGFVCKHSSASGMEIQATDDLRGQTPQTAIGGAATATHSIASHNDTTATGAELETLTDTSDADALHAHATKVTGPGSSTDNAIARFHLTTGKVIQNSAPLIDDSGNVNFLNAKAIAMVCDNGTAVPTSGVTKGQWFCHSPTGRDIIMIYDGSDWKPNFSLGSITFYVGYASASDVIDNGWGNGSGESFATIEYAKSKIPPSFGGHVIINIAEGTFNEDTDIQGKNATDAYSVTYQGTLTTTGGQAARAQTSSVQGTGATQGSISDTVVDVSGFAGKLLYSSNNDEYRVIDSATTNTMTICGTWTAAPSGDYTVYEWGTIINSTTIGIHIKGGQKSIIIQDIKFTGGAAVKAENFTETEMKRCNVTSAVNQSVEILSASFLINECYFNYTNNTGQRAIGAAFPVFLRIRRTKVNANGNVTTGFRLIGGNAFVAYGSVFDNCDATTGGGIFVESNGSVNFFSPVSEGYSRIRNCATNGISARRGGIAVVTSNNQYSGNGVDELDVGGVDSSWID